MLKRALIYVLLSGLITTSAASAQEMSKLKDSINVLDSSLKRVEKVVNTANKIAMGRKHDAMERFLNGIYLLKHKRPQDAVALFLSLINHPQLGKEATFYLSEAMYMNRNYLVAADYYRRVILQKWNPAFRSKAIKRILEISMKTHSFKGIQEVISVVENDPEMKKAPAVLYARGKYAYFQADEIIKKSRGIGDEENAIRKFNEALSFFDMIKPILLTNGKYKFPDLYAQAVYYSGATLVRLALAGAISYSKDGKMVKLEKWTSSPAVMREMLLLEAVKRFSYLAATPSIVKLMKAAVKSSKSNSKPRIIFVPRNQDEKDIQNLARMAMGRIFYEIGETRESIKWYSSVDKKSRFYEDALYEMAWVYVRENSVVKATEVLALMEARNKNSIFLPRAKLLLGYLKVRGGKWVEATKSFNKTSIRYGKVYKGIEKLSKINIDIQQFFDQIVRSSSKKSKVSSSKILSINYNIPDEAMPMFRNDFSLMKSILVTGDVQTIKKGIYEAKSALQIIKRRLKSASKIGIFPMLKDIRTKTYGYEFTNMELRKNLLKLAYSRLTKYLSPELKRKLKVIRKRREKLEAKIATMPKSTDSLKLRLVMRRKIYDKKIMKVDNLKKDLESYRRFLTALYQYYKKLPPEKRKKLAYMKEKFRTEADNLKSVMDMANEVRSRIVDASLDVGVDDNSMQEEKLTRSEYRKIISEEFGIYGSVKSSYTGSDAVLFDDISVLMGKSDRIDQRMNIVNDKLVKLADAKLLKIKGIVARETVNIKEYEKLYKIYDQRNSVLSKDITKDSLKSVAAKFYDIVIESDLGIVDVSWSRRAKSREQWVKMNNKYTKLYSGLKRRFYDVEQFKVKVDDKKYSDPFSAISVKKVKKKALKPIKTKNNGGKTK